MTTTELIEQANKDYKPFPSFKDWPKVESYEELLNKQIQKITELKNQIGEEDLLKGQNFVKTVAAIDTGAIEGLYESDRGSTFAIALHTAMLDSTAMKSAEVSQRYLDMETYLDIQIKTYEKVLDFATNSIPITEAYIRELHREICWPQKKYRARTILNNEEMIIEKDLKHGQYKDEPNHVRLADGNIHSYAPVHETKPEMERLVREINSEAFQAANAVTQASYVHYVFVSIHPFSDGNGRVARALSSIFTYRSCNVPYLVLVEDKLDYYRVLSEADNGNYSLFVKFSYDRIFDAINLIVDSFRMAPKQDIDKHISDIESLYKSGSYTYEQVDDAGEALLDLLGNEIFSKVEKLNRNKAIKLTVGKTTGHYQPKSSDMRSLVKKEGLRYTINCRTDLPARAQVDMSLIVEVPFDAGMNEEIIIRDTKYNQNFTARLSEIIPKVSNKLQQRVDWYTNHILDFLLEKLKQGAEQSLINSGYRKS